MVAIQRVGVVFGLITLAGSGFCSPARGQAIAFVPIVAPAFTGSTMTVTPVVSPDRRYVRLSVNPSFNVVNGFQSFTSQLGAVGGGNTGGLGGVNLNAGMNGVIGQPGLDYGSGIGQAGFVGQPGELRAGPLPSGGGFGADPSILIANGLDPGAAIGWDGWQGGDFAPAQSWPLVEAPRATTSSGRGVNAASKSGPSQRRAARKSSSRRQSSSSRRPSR